MTSRKDLRYKKGSDAKIFFGFRNAITGSYNTSGYSAQFIVKSSYDGTPEELLNLTTENNAVINRPSEPLQFEVNIPRTVELPVGSYPGEFWITDSGDKRRCIWAGLVTVTRSHLG